ncbi:hypothetical protein E2562_009477 [Oryza meyeriana var. granulata]|uniref:BED-type domain-containing protein n=1 Tax=Oryza meyeriana var. granulata TaxID=110450 RepID=A0A6G1BU04_9ORYZ|nr:hypothetical protein E2562_009477 [Oryza meyeriana var. granulata]
MYKKSPPHRRPPAVDQFRGQAWLPRFAAPWRYELRLRPDLITCSFTGAASVLVDVSAPTRFLVLNTADLAIDRASIRFQDLAPTGVSLFEEDEILVLEFGGELSLGERSKKCTSSVWKYFTKKKEVLEVDGKQFEQLWGYCNFPNCKQRYRAEGVCGTTAFKNHLKSKHSIVEGQQQLKVGKNPGKEQGEGRGEDSEEDNEEAKDMESYPDIMDDADEL